MTRHSIAGLCLTAALALGTFVLASDAASAAGRGPAGGPPARSTPTGGGGGPTGDGGGPDGDSQLAFFLAAVEDDCPPTKVDANCHPHPKPVRPVVAEKLPERCSTLDYPRIILPSGRVIINYRASKVRFCTNLQAMQ